VSSAINNGFFPENMAIYAAGVVALLAEIGQVYLSVGSWSVILSTPTNASRPLELTPKGG